MKNTRSWFAMFVAGGLTLFAADASAQYEETQPQYVEPPTQYVAVEVSPQQPVPPQQPVVTEERSEEAERRERERREMIIIEATGAYGVQFGETSYLPSGAAGQWEHPIVHGYAVGATAGVVLVPGLALIANYEFTESRSREGTLPGVIDEIQGHIEYHTVVAGLRLYHRLGFGTIHAEVAGGVVLPYETQLDVDYGAGLGALPVPITGTGSRIEHFSVGFGGHGLIGYEVPIFGPLYIAINAKIRTFQAENAGETTTLTNFVTDFAAQPPTATTTEIRHGNGAAAPSTNSVQDARLQLAIGARF